MSAPRPPRFLGRRSYRRRRLIDAARLLPVLGVFIIFLPVLWHPADTPEPDTARGGLHLFAGWLALIVAALLLSRALRRTEGLADGNGAAEPEDR